MVHTTKNTHWIFLMVGTIFLVIDTADGNFSLSTRHLKMEIHHTEQFLLHATNLTIDHGRPYTLEFFPQHKDIVEVTPKSIEIFEANSSSFSHQFTVRALEPGKSEITAVSSSKNNSADNLFLTVEVYRSHTIEVISNIIGWVYFAAWGISFYPQIYYNYKRKSVVGLNFDFLAFNVIGYAMYTVFNIGLYYIPLAKEEYFRRHPRSPNPILPNDIFFVVHGTWAALFTGVQALLYAERGQSLSVIGQVICALYGLTFTISAALWVAGITHLLDFLYICSLIKLVVTVTKYVPQAYMNYSRKSTQGWSIGNVLLDFVGGVGSMLQMFLNAYNYADVHSVMENPTKFGLALLTIAFDVLFMAQHYLWYRKPKYVDSDPGGGSKEPLTRTV